MKNYILFYDNKYTNFKNMKSSGDIMKQELKVYAYSTTMTIIMLSGCVNNSVLEKPNEMADLQGMRGAELTAMIEWKDKLPEDTVEYWYDPDEFELIPTSEPKPNSFGLGNRSVGGAIEEFESDTGLNYEYDEAADYTDKVIHVTVSDKDGELDVKVDWVDAD